MKPQIQCSTARTRYGRRALLGAALTVVLAASAACSSSGSGGSSGAPAGSSAAAGTGGGAATGASAAELTKALAAAVSYPDVAPVSGGVGSLKGKTVWWVPIGASLPIMQSIGAGMKKALAAMGANLHTCDGKLVPTSMASCMDEAAQQHAAAVVGGYIDYKLIPNAYDELVAKHIPVLVGGAAPDGGKTSSAKMAFYDLIATQTTSQRLEAGTVIADSGGKAKILYIGSKDTPELASIAAYAKKFYADHCPGCTFTEIDYLTAAASKLGSQVNAALISNPGTNYVVMEFDPFAGVVANAIQTAGKTATIKLAAAGGGLDSLQRVASGHGQFIDVGSSGYFTGWMFVDAIARMTNGSLPVTTQAPTRVFTAGNVKSLSLTPAVYASNAWYGDDAYQLNFTKAWGLN